MGYNFTQRGNESASDAALEGGTPHASGGAERCLARGCPLQGTTSDSTKGGGPWTCSMHRRAAPDQWDAVSDRARRVPWVWRALARLSHDGASADLAAAVSDFCRRGEMAELAYQPQHEDATEWSWRFRLGAAGWVESGVCRSTPKSLRS
jgi:hypothetical protein